MLEKEISSIAHAWKERGYKQILFICTANFQRSKTCEDLFKGIETGLTISSAGVSQKECYRRGSTLCTVEMLEEADIIYIFEPLHNQRINAYTKGRFKSKLVNLDIPDKYQYGSNELTRLILSKLHSELALNKHRISTE